MFLYIQSIQEVYILQSGHGKSPKDSENQCTVYPFRIPPPTPYNLYAPAKSSLNMSSRGLTTRDNIGKFRFAKKCKSMREIWDIRPWHFLPWPLKREISKIFWVGPRTHNRKQVIRMYPYIHNR